MRKLADEWGGRRIRRRDAAGHDGQDRDNPGQYFNIAFFESRDAAMEHSNSPVTQEFAGRPARLAYIASNSPSSSARTASTTTRIRRIG